MMLPVKWQWLVELSEVRETKWCGRIQSIFRSSRRDDLKILIHDLIQWNGSDVRPRRVVQSMIFRFPPRGCCEGAPLEDSNFYLLPYYVAEWVQTLQSDTRHWCAQSLSPWFSDFLPEARLLKSSNRFTAYSSYPIELKLGRMILDISPLDRLASDCSISSRGRASWNLQIDLQPTVLIRLSWNLVGWY